jgi:DNA-binding PadR family transcriptional regulator
MKSKESKGKEGPLATAALHILLALSESDLHGYGMMQSIKRQSEGSYMGPGTLYANLSGFARQGSGGRHSAQNGRWQYQA